MADRKQIPTETKLRLFSEAAGHCQRPECLAEFLPTTKHLADNAVSALAKDKAHVAQQARPRKHCDQCHRWPGCSLSGGWCRFLAGQPEL